MKNLCIQDNLVVSRNSKIQEAYAIETKETKKGWLRITQFKTAKNNARGEIDRNQKMS